MMPVYAHNTTRSTAYAHMKPYERLCSFIKGMVHIANENVERLVDEVAMWDLPEAQALFGPESCKIQKINSQATLEAYQLDLKMYQELEAKLGACSDCSGQGWYWVNDSQDESHRERCEKCKGCGKTLEAAAKLMTVDAEKAVAAATAKPSGITNGVLNLVSGRKFR
jgi:hypothetical protein